MHWNQCINGMNEEQQIIIYNTADGRASVALFARDGMVWMNQNQLAELFDTSVPNISMHISNILNDKELHASSVIKDYLSTAADGKEYSVAFYSLAMILAIGFRVRSPRGTQFRQWANHHLSEYMVKGFVMDDERLKQADGRPDYFEELLARIRDIRASEKRFYQKVRDLFALSSDYDPSDKATQMFFAETQNKLLYAVTQQTAAELVMARANSSDPHMGLTSWKGSVVRKQDILVAKNYLGEDELDTLNRLVTLFLESAELRAKNRQEMRMDFWRTNVDAILQLQDKNILDHAGSISNAEMEAHVRKLYARFDADRKKIEAAEEDRKDMDELRVLERKVERKK